MRLGLFTQIALKLFGFLLICVGVVAGFYWIFQRTGPRIVEIKPREICDLQIQDCNLEFSDNRGMTFSIQPRPVPAKDPIRLKVQLRNIEATAVAVDFSGLDAETPFRRPYLSREWGTDWIGTTDLTHCSEEKMNWRVTVLIERNQETWAVPFQIVTLQDYGRAADFGVRLPPKPQGGDFEVQTAKGKLSSKSLRGKFFFLYFGYTHCPDICPTTLSTLGTAFKKLSPQELSRVRGLFVSVDPERDKLDPLHDYASFFHSAIEGATSDDSNLRKIISQFGGVFRIQKKEKAGDPKNADPHYTVDHSGDMYLIDPDGRWVETLPHGIKRDQVLEILRRQMVNYEKKF